MCKFTDYLQSPKLTLFVETKWAEWWDSFSHESLRGKGVYLFAGLLSSLNKGTYSISHAVHTLQRNL